MRILAVLILSAATVITCGCFPAFNTNRLKIDPRQIHFVDSSTEKPIAEILVIPQYVLVKSRSTPFKKRDDTYQDYVSSPFLFRQGNIYRPIESKTKGVVWIPGCMFTGKEILMKGALVLAPGYQPRWFSTSEIEVTKGNFVLHPISKEKSSQAMQDILKQISGGTLHMPEECSRFYLSPCTLEVRFNRNELALVRSYLESAEN